MPRAKADKAGPTKNKKGKRLSKKDRERKRKREAEEAANGGAPEASANAAVDGAHAAPLQTAGAARARPVAALPAAGGALESVFEDDDILAISKPAGMLSHPSPGFWTHGTVAHALVGRVPKAMLEERKGSSMEKDSSIPRAVVHRLDRGTTGLMLIAKTPRAEAHLAAQFRARGAKKRYVAVLHNLPRLAQAGEAAAHRLYVDAPLGRDADSPNAMALLAPPLGKSAVSVFHVHAHCAVRSLSLVSVELHTGRQHQIRAHAALVLGAPVANDETYGVRPAVERLRAEFGGLGKGRPLLHSWQVDVPHCADGKPPLSLRCPLPPDMAALIAAAWPALDLDDPGGWGPWQGDADEAARNAAAATAAAEAAGAFAPPAKRKKPKPDAELNLVSDDAMMAFAKAYKPAAPRADDVPSGARAVAGKK